MLAARALLVVADKRGSDKEKDAASEFRRHPEPEEGLGKEVQAASSVLEARLREKMNRSNVSTVQQATVTLLLHSSRRDFPNFLG